MIYLHEKKEEIGGFTREGLEIIDGQQRLTAIYRYVEGAFRLFDPRTENDKAKFPRFLLEQPCPWAGKFFRELPPELQDGLRETTLLLAMIQSDDIGHVSARAARGLDLVPTTTTQRLCFGDLFAGHTAPEQGLDLPSFLVALRGGEGDVPGSVEKLK